jgi:hypothetical protein
MKLKQCPVNSPGALSASKADLNVSAPVANFKSLSTLWTYQKLSSNGCGGIKQV